MTLGDYGEIQEEYGEIWAGMGEYVGIWVTGGEYGWQCRSMENMGEHWGTRGAVLVNGRIWRGMGGYGGIWVMMGQSVGKYGGVWGSMGEYWGLGKHGGI